jgi:hypothetical protein
MAAQCGFVNLLPRGVQLYRIPNCVHKKGCRGAAAGHKVFLYVFLMYPW